MKLNEKTGKWESDYWHPAVTADAVFLSFDDEGVNVLLIERAGEPFKGKLTLPGGFMTRSDESATATVSEVKNLCFAWI